MEGGGGLIDFGARGWYFNLQEAHFICFEAYFSILNNRYFNCSNGNHFWVSMMRPATETSFHRHFGESGGWHGPSSTTKTQPKHLPLSLPTFFLLFFSGGEEPLPGFPFWCFVAGPVVKLRLRRPRELGDRALRKKELDVPPSCLAKEILC